MAIDFAPFASLKKLLNLEKAAITDYPQLQEIVARTKAAFESHLGYHLDLDDYTYSYFQQTATKFIFLNALPIISVDSVSIDGQEVTGYKVTNYGIMLPAKVYGVVISTTHEGGYEDDTYPYQIKEAALVQVCYEYGMVDNLGATITTTDGGSIQRPELGLLKETKRLLDPFQSPSKSMCL